MTWLNVSLNFAMDSKPITFPQSDPMLAPGTSIGKNTVYGLQIPSSYAPGNHTMTAEAIYQYFDNSTGKWTTAPDSPLIESIGLIVNDPPSTIFLHTMFLTQTAPLAIALGVLGVFPVALAFRRRKQSLEQDHRRASRDFPEKKTGFRKKANLANLVRFLLLALPGLVVYTLSRFPLGAGISHLLVQAGLLGELVVVLISIGFWRMDSGAAFLFSVLCLSLSATLASTGFIVTSHLPSACLPGMVGAGFPFQWSTQFVLYQGGPYSGPALLCPFPSWIFLDQNPVASAIYFLVDTMVYATIALGIIVACKAAILLSRRLRLAP
jgi:hypothetical protein